MGINKEDIPGSQLLSKDTANFYSRTSAFYRRPAREGQPGCVGGRAGTVPFIRFFCLHFAREHVSFSLSLPFFFLSFNFTRGCMCSSETDRGEERALPKEGQLFCKPSSSISLTCQSLGHPRTCAWCAFQTAAAGIQTTQLAMWDLAPSTTSTWSQPKRT